MASGSMRVISAMPIRARASATSAPTLPRPTTPTRRFWMCPLRTDAPGVDGPALEFIVFESAQYRGFPMDGVLHRRGDSDLSAPRADDAVVGLFPEAGAPVSVVAHGHAEQRLASGLGGVDQLAFGGDVGGAQVLPSG